MDDSALFSAVLVGGLVGFGLLYLVIKTAVYNALIQFLRAAAREGGARGNFDVPNRLDKVASHIAELARNRDHS